MAEIIESAGTDNGEVISIGKKLAQARQLQHLSIEQVARYLRLSESVIKSLESDTATAEIPATYIRGYVRAYAKLLNLELDQQTPIATPTASTKDAGIAGIQNLQSLPQSHAKIRTFSAKAVLLTVLSLVLVAGGVWWWKLGFVLPQMATTKQPSSSETAVMAVPSLSENSVRGEVALDLADENNATNANNNVSIEATTNAPTTETVNVATAPVSVSSETNKTETVAAPEKTTTVDVARGGETLEFVFDEDCWVRVIDGNGEVLAVGTKRAGVRFVVAGPAPVTVDLGNPVGVQLKHNNRAVDLSAYPGGRPAHLTIQPTKFE